MNNVILAIFPDRATAEPAVAALRESGYGAQDISIIVKDKVMREQVRGSTGGNMVQGAASGIAAGSVAGGMAGLLAGIGAISLPGLGAILMGGPIAIALGLTGAAALTVEGAVTGAVAGGLVGSLVGLGIPPEIARMYEDRIREGAVLVAVPLKGGKTGDARTILNSNGAMEVRSLPIR